MGFEQIVNQGPDLVEVEFAGRSRIEGAIPTLTGEVVGLVSSSGFGGNPAATWETTDVGRETDEHLTPAIDANLRRCLAAAGIPEGVLTGNREARRTFIGTAAVPVARLLGAELSDKLDSAVVVSFPSLARSDPQTGRMFKQLLECGYSRAQVADFLELPTPEGQPRAFVVNAQT